MKFLLAWIAGELTIIALEAGMALQHWLDIRP